MSIIAATATETRAVANRASRRNREYPVWLAWYPSPYPDDSSVMVEVVDLTCLPIRRRRPDVVHSSLGYVRCESIEAAIAQVPLLQLELGVPIWRGVFAIRGVTDQDQDQYPREWRKIDCPVPGQEWPESAVKLGGCLECGDTGICAECGGATLDPDAPCICGYECRCAFCRGTLLLLTPYHYRVAIRSIADARECIEEENRQIEEEKQRQRDLVNV